MEMPKPSDAHRKLEKLVGQWVGQETVHPSPFDPEGGPAEGRVNNRTALDGFVVVQDYTQQRGGKISFQGHGIFRYDADSSTYVMHWFDSFGAAPSEFRGDFEGDSLTLTSSEPHGLSRATFVFPSPDTYEFKMEVSPDSENWYPFLEGTYAKGG
jgi:hypothetical protein